MNEITEAVKEYYGKVLDGTEDGCGSPIPPLLDGISVLDLGCGSAAASADDCCSGGPCCC